MNSRRLSLTISISIISLIAIILSAAPVIAASGSLSLSRSSGNVGETIEIAGSNFINNGSISSIMFGTASNVLSESIDIAEGEFNTSLEIPNLPKNIYTITITSTGGDTASAPFTITPSMGISTSSGQSGNQIILNGNGFAASSKLNIFFDYSSTAIATGTTNSIGSFSGLALTAPETVAGNHNIKVVDSAGNQDTVAYMIKPKITVSPVCIIPGTQVTFSGTGFAPSSSVTITLDNTLKLTDSVSTDTKGTLTGISLKIPAVSAGTHVFDISDVAGNSGTISVNTSSTLTVSPPSGPVGGPVTLIGSGFNAYENISITFGSKLIADLLPVSCDKNGYFKTILNVPLSVSGSYIINAADNTNSASVKFIATASASMESQVSQIKVGDEIPILGNGFNSDSNVNIKYDNATMTSTQTDSNGSFSSSIIVPPGTPGKHKITFTDGVNSTYFNISIAPSSKTNITKGYIGTGVNISGDAFSSGSTVSIKYDSEQVATASADTNGSFSVSFKVPVSKSGNHVITVTDGVINNTFNFLLNSEPPSVPLLSYPSNNARIDSPAKFQWSSITAFNGNVTYEIQISTDSLFNNPVVIKKGISSNTYQMDETENELLKSTDRDHPYYWRVKAVDAASDASPWSMSSTFNVGFVLPVWVWYIICGFGAIILFGGGFFVGKKFGNNIGIFRSQ